MSITRFEAGYVKGDTPVYHKTTHSPAMRTQQRKENAMRLEKAEFKTLDGMRLENLRPLTVWFPEPFSIEDGRQGSMFLLKLVLY